MKIWLLAENWSPRWGGIENYLEHVARELGEAGNEVTVIAPVFARRMADSPVIDVGKNVAVARRRFFWPIIKPTWLPLFFSLWRLAARERPDVILCGKGLFEGLIGYYFLKQRQIPYVVFTYAMEIVSWSAARGARRKLKRVLGAAHRVVCINEEVKNILVSLGAAPEKIRKITPGVDVRFLRAVEPSVIEATVRHLGLRQPYILTLGRLVERKGFDTLIEAFSRLDQTKYALLKLVIVGDGPDRARLEKIVADNYMQTSVVFLGVVDNSYLAALYAGAELFAMLPRDVAGDIEGFGIVYLEAGAQGVAVLGTVSGGVTEAVVDDLTGRLVAPNNVEASARMLTTLLSDASLRGRLGRAARQRIESEFQWKSRREDLLGLLEPITQKSA